MVKSMTGYGIAQGNFEKIKISVEVKSVNNRFFDCSVRLPRMFISAEEAVKGTVKQYISRGKIDVFINVDSSEADNVLISLNEPLLSAYLDAFKKIAEKEDCIEYRLDAMSLGRLPDVLQIEKAETDSQAFTAALLPIVEEAMSGFDLMRTAEGNKLCADISEKLGTIENLVSQIAERSPKTVNEYAARMEKRISDLLAGSDIDQTRILTEVAIFADKTAIDEELVRLQSHIAQLKTMLQSSEAIGRKMDFLIQEFNREANTIGSKGNDTEIARLVVDLKSEIEKIREQAQNIE